MTRLAAAVAVLALVQLGAAPGPRAVPAAAQSRCSQQYLPDQDPACTPGATDPRVTQDDVQQTICRPGYSAGVRPPAAYTEQLKRQGIADYGYSATNPADYEEDHLVSGATLPDEG